MFESRHHSELIGLCIEAVFRFGGRDVADRLEQAAVVEPVDPFEGCELDCLQAAPRPSAVNDLCLEQADYSHLIRWERDQIDGSPRSCRGR